MCNHEGGKNAYFPPAKRLFENKDVFFVCMVRKNIGFFCTFSCGEEKTPFFHFCVYTVEKVWKNLPPFFRGAERGGQRRMKEEE